MKSTFTLPSFGAMMFYLSCLLSFSIFFGCGDTEDIETEFPIVAEIKPTDLELAEVSLAPNDTLLRVESIFEQLNAEEERVPVDWESTKDPISRAAYARFLLSSGKKNIPRDWYKTKDPVLNAEYKRAQLTKQFGNIPAVRILSDFTLKQALGLPRWTSLDEYITELEANYYLFPNEANLRTLEKHRKMKKEGENVIFVSDAEFQLRKTVADFIQKLAQQQPVTDAECKEFLKAHAELRQLKGEQPLSLHEEYAILEAQNQLGLKIDKFAQRRLEKFRRAKSEGIPFRDIDWDGEDEG